MSTTAHLDEATGDIYVDFGDGVYTKVTATGEVETDVTRLPGWTT